MSTTIDERVVEMRFDNSKFENNAKTTMSTLDRLKQALKFDGAGKSFEDISSAASKVKFDGITGACETVSAKFSALQVAAYTALANITNDAVNAGKKIVSALTIDGAIDGFKEYELKMGSVQTIMNSSGESLEVVMNYLEELNRYADQTIYSFSDMTTSIGKFTNAGVDLKTSVAAIQGISNAVALSGGAADKASMAMYNFAQALSIGYVGLQDWKSIELSGMATLDFKKSVMETAVELGTLKKEADGTFKTIEKGTEVTAEGMREALKEKWFTSDVLTTVLAKYSDTTTELGQKAVKAATEVKTFSMMMDTLKESIGSGWATTWENVIGNFNQATDFFTNATEKLSGMIDAQAKSRNKFMKDAFNTSGISDVSKWNQVSMAVQTAGADVGAFKEELIKTAKAHGVEIDKMIEEAGSFEATLKSGWLNSELFQDALNDIQKLGGTSPVFQKLAYATSDSNKAFKVMRDELTSLSGRTHVINSLNNIMKALENVVKPVKEAFRELFPAKTGQDLRNVLAGFEEFTKKLILSETQMERVKNTFRGFFTVLRSAVDAVGRIGEAFSPLKDIFSILFQNLVEGIEYFGNFFLTLEKGDESTSRFQKALNVIHDSLQYFADHLQEYIDNIKAGWDTLKAKFSESWNEGPLSKVAAAIEKIKTALSGFGEGLSAGFAKFMDTFSNKISTSGDGFNKITSILTKFGEGLKKAWDLIKAILTPIVEKLKEFVSGIDIIDSMAVAFEAGGLAAISAVVGNFIDNIGDLGEQVKVVTNPIETMTGFVQQLGDIFGALETKIRTDIVTDFAKSVGILAASIFVLSTIDAEGARRAVGIVTLLMGELIGLFKVLESLSTIKSIEKVGVGSFFDSIKSTFGQVKVASGLLTMVAALKKFSEAILILAAAMKVVSTIPFPEMAASFVAISALLWEMVGVAKALSTSKEDMVVGAGGLITLASSVMILATAMKIIASIDIPSLVASGIALTVLIGELVAVCKLLEGNEGITGAGSMIALAAAVMILAGAMKIMASMSFEEISKGLFAVAGVLVELGVALALMPAALPGAAALLIASAGILVLAGALKVMGSIGAEKILPLLGLLGGVLGEMAIGLTLMILALPGAAALLVASKALAILTPVLIALAAVPTESINKALGNLAKTLGLFAVAGTILGILSPALLLFAAALLAVSVATVGIGVGLAAAGAGLSAIALAMGLLAEIGEETAERFVESLKIIGKGLITLIPDMVLALGQGIVKILELISNSGPQIKNALRTVTEVLVQVFTEMIPKITKAFSEFLLNLISQIAEYTPQITDAFFQLIEGVIKVFTDHIPVLTQQGIDIMVAFIQGVQESQNQLIDAAFEAIIAFINGLAESIETHTPELIEAVKRLFEAVLDAMLLVMSGGNQDFVRKAHEIIDAVKRGINEKIGEAKNAIVKMVNDMVGAIKEKVNDFKDAASQLVNGFINGIKNKINEAKEAVKGLAGDAVSALKNALDIHSPSRVAASIGSFFGQGFSKGVSDETHTAESASASLAMSATEAMNTALDAMISKIEDRGAEFEKIGETIVNHFIVGFEQASPIMVQKLDEIFSNFSLGMDTENASAQESTSLLLENILRVISSFNLKFRLAGEETMNKFIQGCKIREQALRLTWTQLMQSALSAVNGYYGQFYSVGQNIADGLRNGIQSKVGEIAASAAEAVKAAIAAARKEADVHSPSRVFYGIGAYIGEGLALGIDDSESRVSNAGAKLAMAAIRAAAEMVEDGIDTNPVITPVIDLSSVEEGTHQISSMLSKTQAISISADLNQNGVNSQASQIIAAQNANNATPNITFTQNNYSPKALSRYEIYRQTNAQISKMRGVLA